MRLHVLKRLKRFSNTFKRSYDRLLSAWVDTRISTNVQSGTVGRTDKDAIDILECATITRSW